MTTELQHLIYVEDEPDIQSIVKLALETLGNMSVDVFSSGEEALKHAPDLSPQMVLLDVMMPGMDGPATMTALKSLPNYGSLPYIFITAKNRPEEVKDLMNMGAFRVLPKPFDPLMLATELKSLWRQFQQA